MRRANKLSSLDTTDRAQLGTPQKVPPKAVSGSRYNINPKPFDGLRKTEARSCWPKTCGSRCEKRLNLYESRLLQLQLRLQSQLQWQLRASSRLSNAGLGSRGWLNASLWKLCWLNLWRIVCARPLVNALPAPRPHSHPSWQLFVPRHCSH